METHTLAALASLLLTGRCTRTCPESKQPSWQGVITSSKPASWFFGIEIFQQIIGFVGCIFAEISHKAGALGSIAVAFCGAKHACGIPISHTRSRLSTPSAVAMLSAQRAVMAIVIAAAITSAAAAAPKRGDIRFSTVSPKLCDPDVVQYAGYVTIDPKEKVEYFFWFFGSRSPTAYVEWGARLLWPAAVAVDGRELLCFVPVRACVCVCPYDAAPRTPSHCG